jgi:hypothetical protein
LYLIRNSITNNVDKGMFCVPRNIPQTEDDFLDAQREAIRRVRDMQSRARHTLESAGVHLEPTPTLHPRATPVFENTAQIEHDAFERPQQARPHVEEPIKHHYEQTHKENPIQPQDDIGFHIPFISDIINGGVPSLPIKIFDISLDNEQIMILIVLYVLYMDKADPYLMVALGYILL